MGAKKQTVGYHYLFSILFGLSRGPLNELRTIQVADKIAWEGPLCSGDVQAIKKPDLFGGKKKEGGIQGPFRLFFGDADQVLPGAGSANCGSSGPLSGVQTLPDIKATITADVPTSMISEFRGVTMLWFDGLISSMNPYPKEWSFRVRRYSAGWDNDACWYIQKSVIFLGDGKIHAMNPAHIIYECLTNPAWGRGLPAIYLDDNSFVYAANTLCDEGFGLCFAWNRQENVDDFISTVIDHIGGALYPDPETGRMVLKLIRSDYVADDLPLFTPTSGLLDITEDDSSSQDDIYNEIIGTGRDPITNEDFQVRVHNLAARQSQGAPNTEPKDYSGVPTRDLLARILQRDLKLHASGLKKFAVVLDRSGWRLRPGMCFRISDSRRGISNIVLRVGEITDQSFKDGKVTVKAMQDVYGLPATAFVTPIETKWTAPPTEALPTLADEIVEANYRDILLRKGPADVSALTDTDSFIGTLAASPSTVMYEYALASRAAGEPDFDTDTTGSFTGTATLTTDLTELQTVFVVTGEISFDADNIGQAILIDDEQMEFQAYDPATHEVTVARGVADTIPQTHLSGARIWTIDDDLVSDGRNYVSGETVEAKVLTRTSSDVLDEADADLLSLVMVGRQARPYPPGDVQVDGDSIFSLADPEYPEPVFTWAHRDRVLQEDQLVGFTDASIGPEPGVDYTIRIYNADDPLVVLRTEAGIAADTWTYDAAMQLADGSPYSIWVELEAVRDGLASYQHYRFFVPLQSGYGLGYGFNYGGA